MWTRVRGVITGGPEERRSVRFDTGITPTSGCPAIDLDPTETRDPRGGESVSLRGPLVGCLRAAHPGHTVGTTIEPTHLPIALSAVGTRRDVEILGERRGASVVEAPLHDPEGGRMRG